jgi:hypothetical protein
MFVVLVIVLIQHINWNYTIYICPVEDRHDTTTQSAQVDRSTTDKVKKLNQVKSQKWTYRDDLRQEFQSSQVFGSIGKVTKALMRSKECILRTISLY